MRALATALQTGALDRFRGLVEYPRSLAGGKVYHVPSLGRIPCFNDPVTASTETRDTAGVPFPPPLAFIGALGTGFALQYLVPIRILRNATGLDTLQWAGAGLLLAAIALAIHTFTCFYLARTSPFPERPTTSLIIRGPFRFTRNPLYLAMSLVHTGVALFANALWPLLFLVPAVLAIRFLVIAREEAYLLRRFGPEYEAYCRSVRRWI